MPCENNLIPQYPEEPLKKLLKELVDGDIDVNSDTYQYSREIDDPHPNGCKTKMVTSTCTPLLLAIEVKAIPVIEALVKDGADVCKCGGPEKVTPLIQAVKTGSVEIVDFLLKNGAELTVPSALSYAAKKSSWKIVDLLLQDLEKRGAYSATTTALWPAALNAQNTEEIIYLLRGVGIDLNLRNEDGATLLEVNIKKDNVQVVRSLTKAGADVDLATSSGKTPLALAASLNNLPIVAELVKSGADVKLAAEELEQFAARNVDCAFYLEALADKKVKAKKNKGVFLAIEEDDFENVEELVTAGSDVRYTSNKGETVLQALLQKGYKFMAVIKKFAKPEEFSDAIKNIRWDNPNFAEFLGKIDLNVDKELAHMNAVD